MTLRRQALQTLVDAGGSMDFDEFRRTLAKIHPNKGGATDALSHLRRLGLTQHRVHLTASGLAKLAKTAP